MALAEELKKHSFNVIPGWKLCSKCYTKTTQINSSESQNISDDSASSEASWEESVSVQLSKRKLDHSLTAIGISPIASAHSVPKRVRITEAKKINKAVRNLESSFSSTIEIPAISFSESPTTPSQTDHQALKQTEQDYMEFLHSIKEKLQQTTSSEEKVHL